MALAVKSASERTSATRQRVERVFDEMFEDILKKQPAAPAKAAVISLRERASMVAHRTAFAQTILLEEHLLEKIGDAFAKEKTEDERIAFDGGYFRKIRQLSSKNNTVGDVSLAVKVHVENGTEREGELVVLKMLRDEKEILGKNKSCELSKEERELIGRLYYEAGLEMRHLERFKDNVHIVSPTGGITVDLQRHRLIAQMEYVPHSFHDYLWSIDGERKLSETVFEAGVQMLGAISYLANHRSEDAPEGWVNNDLKLGNMGVATEDGRMAIKMLDLDSIRPISRMLSVKKETKYSPDHCDPEKFMELHDHEVAMNAKPAETVYSLGLALLYSIAERMAVRLKYRCLIVFPAEYAEETEHVPTARSTMVPGLDEMMERTTRVSIVDCENLRSKLEKAVETDELNLLKAYIVNKKRMEATGKATADLPEIGRLMEKHSVEVACEIEPAVALGMGWLDRGKANGTGIADKATAAGKLRELVSGFALDDRTAASYGVKGGYEKLVLGIEFNIEKITDAYARVNYDWHLPDWYKAVTEMLESSAGLTREDAAKIVELAKREERGRRSESAFAPEVFEGIACCLKRRAERPDAERMAEMFMQFRNKGDIDGIQKA
ncbi:hypothetical protein H0O02_00975 [Candidatus Micrarchaeota archaeon]|nr:hypothetical protein [Candidatus Micrarchaeota archaeon]